MRDETEVIDLGAASVETKGIGGVQFRDPNATRYDLEGLSED